jgi:4-deoxy-L-threo-5-hexosulose-uronate ketol-isomerase
MREQHLHYTTRLAADPAAAARMTKAELRERFLVGGLFEPGRLNLTYTHYDRFVVGGAMPMKQALSLEAIPATGTKSFLERRELIAVNIGGAGSIAVDGEPYGLRTRDMLYVGMGATVSFESDDASAPAKFYLLSAPAHHAHPTALIRTADAKRVDLGNAVSANERSIFQFIHPQGARTCQLVVGITQLASGSVWNTMPPHVHDRRTEVYLYFDLPEAARIFHFMGEPGEDRHLVIANEEAVISPPWSIHSGCGTASYAFVWAMAGDNVDYTDVDPVPLEALR